MIKVLLYSFLLVLGLIGPQFRAGIGDGFIKIGIMFSSSLLFIAAVKRLIGEPT